jgi:hypothetical protein
MKTTKRTCQAETKAGTTCRAAALPDSDFCFFHDPEHEAERREAQSAGGRQSRIKTLPEDSPAVKVENCRDVVALVSETINQVRRGQVDPRVANAVGYLLNIALKAVEQGDVERRLAELEAAVKGQRPSTGLGTTEA